MGRRRFTHDHLFLVLSSDGYALSQYLPYDNIRFCNHEELTYLRGKFHEHAGQNLGLQDDVGYCLEVTLQFPEDKKDYFAEYPPLR